MMDMRSFPKPQLMPAKIEDIAVAHAFDRTAVVPVAEIDAGAKLARYQHGIGRVLDKTVHPAAFVGLEVTDDDVSEPLWIEHLRDRRADGVVGVIEARVD